MNISRLKAILEKEKIDPIDYDILGKGYVGGYDGFIINKADNGDFRLYYCIIWNEGNVIYCFKQIQKNRSALNFCA